MNETCRHTILAEWTMNTHRRTMDGHIVGERRDVVLCRQCGRTLDGEQLVRLAGRAGVTVERAERGSELAGGR